MATTQATTTDESQTTERTAESRSNTESTHEASTERPRGLPQDVVFGLLSAERRRRLLVFLDEIDGETTLNEAAEVIAAEENDVAVSELTSDQRKRVYVGLYQSHLPKLADAAVIEYDRDRGTIALNEAVAERLFPHLRIETAEYEQDVSLDERPISTRLRRRLSGVTDRVLE